MRSWILLPLLVTSAFAASAGGESPAPAPPYPWPDAPPDLPPAWVFEPWVWEDDENTQAATLALVAGHRERGLPVGAVIVDSPWEAPGEAGYHTFRFDPARYPDPAAMIETLRGQGVRVVVWATGNLVPEAPGYAEACRAGFFVRAPDADEACPTTSFWKGSGRASHVDFFHPEALRWWRELVGRALALGVDGVKVDGSDLQLRELGPRIATHAGLRSQDEYGAAFYGHFLRIVREARGAEGAILARPFADENGVARFYAPREHCTACWVGDQERSFDGLREAVYEVLISAGAGYPVVGSDVGGFRPEPDPEPDRRGTAPADEARLFARWAQLGALLPLMEVGGRGEHRPWAFGERTLRIYRRYARLHSALAPWLRHLAVAARRGEGAAVRALSLASEAPAYLLGGDLLVAPVVAPARRRAVELPEGRWVPVFAPAERHDGPKRLTVWTPLERVPLFLREGALLAWKTEDDAPGLLALPGTAPVRRTLHLAEGPLAVALEPDPDGLRVTLRGSGGRHLVEAFLPDGRVVAGRVAADGAPVALRARSGTLGGPFSHLGGSP